MKVVYARQEPPKSFSRAIFLAGPTPRSEKVASWRPEALRILEKLGYDGVVFVPEYESGERPWGYQVEWEEMGLNMADCILFWVPRELKDMPAFTTNTEWGRWEDSGKVVFGAPPSAARVRYQRYYAEKFKVPMSTTLEETVQNTLDLIGEGSLRTSGEREVPLYIWRTNYFQQWYSAQKQAGNRLDGARVKWVFRVGPKRNIVFLWAIHANIYVASEKRNKTNEVVLARPDISTIVMYRRRETPDNSDIVLIREFRSPAATADGFVWEAPGGSSWKPKKNPLELAADECSEETGLKIAPDRIKCHESRQLAATFSTHKAHLFSVEITEEELKYLRSQYGIPHGVIEDTERTYVEILKLGDIRQDPNIDWSMYGMILSVLTAPGC